MSVFTEACFFDHHSGSKASFFDRLKSSTLLQNFFVFPASPFLKSPNPTTQPPCGPECLPTTPSPVLTSKTLFQLMGLPSPHFSFYYLRLLRYGVLWHPSQVKAIFSFSPSNIRFPSCPMIPSVSHFFLYPRVATTIFPFHRRFSLASDPDFLVWFFLRQFWPLYGPPFSFSF